MFTRWACEVAGKSSRNGERAERDAASPAPSREGPPQEIGPGRGHERRPRRAARRDPSPSGGSRRCRCRPRAACPSPPRSRCCREARSRPPAAPCRGRGRGRSRRSRRSPPPPTSGGRHSASTASPSRMPESAMPTSTPGSAHAHEPEHPAEGHHHRERHRQQPHRRRPELRAPEAHRHHRQHVVETGDRVVEAGEEALGAALLDVGPRERRPERREEGERGRALAPTSVALRRQQHQRALDRPVGPERAHGVAGQAARTSRGQRTSSTRKERSSRTTSRTNATCPSSTPTLKRSSASGISACGSPIEVRPLAKPKPWSRPNAKATTQGWRIVKLVSPRHVRTISGPRKRMLSAIAALSGGSGRARVAERRDRERDAVREREGRDRLHERPAVGHDQQQAQHEQQVVDAEQDVLDAELDVAERPLAGRGDAAERHRRRRRPQQVALEPAVLVVQAHEHVA